jgi:hypothetical protein
MRKKGANVLTIEEVRDFADALTRVANDCTDELTANRLHRMTHALRELVECGATATPDAKTPQAQRVKAKSH